ncbi:hypothetical protein EBR96_10590, partial [bacterium]|nr:hypothetical protein [bacterium]
MQFRRICIQAGGHLIGPMCGSAWLQEKVLCRICFDREISLVLLPCRHRVLC